MRRRRFAAREIQKTAGETPAPQKLGNLYDR